MALTHFDLWKTLKRLWLTGNGQTLLRESEAIEIDGVLLGAVATHQLGVRFIAANDCVNDMDQSVWPTPEYAHRAARQLFRTNTSRTRSGRLAWTEWAGHRRKSEVSQPRNEVILSDTSRNAPALSTSRFENVVHQHS